jgi:hypothetical protein
MVNKADRQEVISLRWIKRGNYQHPFDRKRNMRKASLQRSGASDKNEACNQSFTARRRMLNLATAQVEECNGGPRRVEPFICMLTNE